jgi:hypothetical protein
MKSVQETVKEINNKLFDQCSLDEVQQDYFNYLEYTETPIGDYIKWLGQYLWDSENDYREWISEDEQESLEDFLIKEMVKVKESIVSQLNVLDVKHKAINSVYKNRPHREEIRQHLLDSCKQEDQQ